MPHTLTIIILLVLFAMPGVAQEADENPGTTATALPGADDATANGDDGEDAPQDEEEDDSDLDLQTYEEDDDDFVPTEEIPADEPIPFPSNI